LRTALEASVGAHAEPGTLLHLAAAPKNADLMTQMAVNAHGTVKLLEAISDVFPKVVTVIAGSAAEYGAQDCALSEESRLRPVADYGISKAAQTIAALSAARRLDLDVRIARIFNVYGNSGPGLAIASIARQIVAAEQAPKPVLEHYNLLSVRDFIHVDDVVRALNHISLGGSAGEIYNVASGVGTALEEAVRMLLNRSAQPIESWTRRARSAQFRDTSVADVTKLRSLGWQPELDLETGLLLELTKWRALLGQTVCQEPA